MWQFSEQRENAPYWRQFLHRKCLEGSQNHSTSVVLSSKKTVYQANFSACTAADVLFVVDSTGSVLDDFNKHRQYVEDVVSQMDVGVYSVGVVLYSSALRKQIKIPFGKHSDRDSLLKAIQGWYTVGRSSFNTKHFVSTLLLQSPVRLPRSEECHYWWTILHCSTHQVTL